MNIITGKFSEEELDRMIRESSKIGDVGVRIALLSKEFLGIDYREHALIGDLSTPEVFVLDLGGVDCFTFIDYVEAMRISASFSEFIANLQKIRYREGRITFEDRNHFFTDWRESNALRVEDVTAEIGRSASVKVRKILNVKEDGTYWVTGIGPVQREIEYIPSGALLVEKVLDGLRTGDYAGIYSDVSGLDVSHVGIVIKDKDNIYLRHASSRHKRVVDENLRNYISGKPGLIILRPRPV